MTYNNSESGVVSPKYGCVDMTVGRRYSEYPIPEGIHSLSYIIVVF